MTSDLSTSCSACGSETITFAVPDELREYAPSGGDVAALCTRCLSIEPVDVTVAGSTTDDLDREPDFSRVSAAFPTDRAAAVPLALALGLARSLATNRSAIEALLERVERAGTDPLLAIDRLASDPAVDPAIDLERRRHQLEQLLY